MSGSAPPLPNRRRGPSRRCAAQCALAGETIWDGGTLTTRSSFGLSGPRVGLPDGSFIFEWAATDQALHIWSVDGTWRALWPEVRIARRGRAIALNTAEEARLVTLPRHSRKNLLAIADHVGALDEAVR